MLGTEVMQGPLTQNFLSREVLGFKAVRFLCDELINSIGLSTESRPAPSRKANNGSRHSGGPQAAVLHVKI